MFDNGGRRERWRRDVDFVHFEMKSVRCAWQTDTALGSRADCWGRVSQLRSASHDHTIMTRYDAPDNDNGHLWCA